MTSEEVKLMATEEVLELGTVKRSEAQNDGCKWLAGQKISLPLKYTHHL
jgi:hypothetical protein